MVSSVPGDEAAVGSSGNDRTSLTEKYSPEALIPAKSDNLTEKELYRR